MIEITENASVSYICQIGKNFFEKKFAIFSIISYCILEKYQLLAYSLDDGTLGVYDETVRLWRIKV